MKVVQKVAQQRYHLKIKLITFQDYVLPNTALENGGIDANLFQHLPYLNEQTKEHQLHLTAIGKTFVYPMGLYSKKINQINQLQSGAIIAIPNDPSNEGRALLILQKQGLITLKAGVGLLATPNDI